VRGLLELAVQRGATVAQCVGEVVDGEVFVGDARLDRGLEAVDEYALLLGHLVRGPGGAVRFGCVVARNGGCRQVRPQALALGQDAVDDGSELAPVERFGEIRIRAVFEPGDAILVAGLCGQQHDRHEVGLGVAAQCR